MEDTKIEEILKKIKVLFTQFLKWIKNLSILEKQRWYLLIPIWIIISFLFATSFTNNFIHNRPLISALKISQYLDWGSNVEVSSDAISTIFSILFSILAGAGSVIISLWIFNEKEREKEIKNFRGLEPVSIESFFLDNTFLENIIENELEKRIFRKNQFTTELILKDKLERINQFTHNIVEQKTKNVPIFILLNNGDEAVIPKNVIILYRKKEFEKHDNNKQYIKTIIPAQVEKGEFYYIEEPLDNFGMLPKEKPLFIISATPEDDTEYEKNYNDEAKFAKKNGGKPPKKPQNTTRHYQDFYTLIKKEKKFIILLEYKPNPSASKNKIRAFQAKLAGNDDYLYITSILPMLNKKNVQMCIEKDLANKIECI